VVNLGLLPLVFGLRPLTFGNSEQFAGGKNHVRPKTKDQRPNNKDQSPFAQTHVLRVILSLARPAGSSGTQSQTD